MAYVSVEMKCANFDPCLLGEKGRLFESVDETYAGTCSPSALEGGVRGIRKQDGKAGGGRREDGEGGGCALRFPEVQGAATAERAGQWSDLMPAPHMVMSVSGVGP